MAWSFFSQTFLGVRYFIWLYFLISIVCMVIVAIYFFKEVIRKKYYEIRFPEKLIKIIIHFPGNMYKKYYRLVPEDKIFVFENKNYVFSDKNLMKNNKFFSETECTEQIITIDGKRYRYEDIFSIKYRWEKYPEIHYFYNIPNPIDFNFNIRDRSAKFKLSGFELRDIHENDLVKKLLTLEGEKNLLKFVMIIAVFNLLGTMFIIAKIMGWLT